MPVPSGPDFGGSPSFRFRLLNREVLIGEQPLLSGLLDGAGKELLGDVVLDEPRPVLGERRMIERSLLQSHIEEPAKEHVVVQHLAKEPIRAHRVKRNQQRSLEKPLGRHRRPAAFGVHRIERRAHRGKHRIGSRLYPPQRMIGRNAFLDREVAEQTVLRINLTAHSSYPLLNDAATMTCHRNDRSGDFSTPC
jgi:hypothetical protein